MFCLSGLVVILMFLVWLYLGCFGVKLLVCLKFFIFFIVNLYLNKCNNEYLSIELCFVDNINLFLFF